MSQQFSCHKISEGCVEAEVLVSADAIMFYLFNPETGVMLEPGHALEEKCISKKILIFPSGKGSSVVQADGLFQLMKHEHQPAGMIVKYPETVLVSSAILFEIPMVDKLDDEFYATVKDGDRIRLDADNGTVTIL